MNIEKIHSLKVKTYYLYFSIYFIYMIKLQ